MATMSNPHALVETGWVEQHMHDPDVRIVDCCATPESYAQGHIPGAVRLNWDLDLANPSTRDLIDTDEFERLARRLGIGNDTTVVFYGNFYNLGACQAYWVFRLYGHERLRIMNGGRQRWVDDGRTLVRDVPAVKPGSYKVQRMHPELRARRDEVLQHIGSPAAGSTGFRLPNGKLLVDDRTPAEFAGKVDPTAEYPLRVLRGGRIPGAENIPYTNFVDAHGTFADTGEMRRIASGKGVTADKDVVVYTRIGERSAMTWFALHELLGLPKVRNYDGSWTEWGNAVGLPIENASLPVIPPVVAGAESRTKNRQARR